MNEELRVLQQRYLYAVTKWLKKEDRQDVALELQSLMDEKLEERCAGRTPDREDLKAVAKELGSPYEIYTRYTDDAEACFISQPWFSLYKLLLKFGLPVMAAIGIFACLMEQYQNPVALELLLHHTVKTVIDLGTASFTVLTVGMALLSRYRVGKNLNSFFSDSFNLEQLPQTPREEDESRLRPLRIRPLRECRKQILEELLALAVILILPNLLNWLAPASVNPEFFGGRWYLLALVVLFNLIPIMVTGTDGRATAIHLAVIGVNMALMFWTFSICPVIVRTEELQAFFDGLFPTVICLGMLIEAGVQLSFYYRYKHR